MRVVVLLIRTEVRVPVAAGRQHDVVRVFGVLKEPIHSAVLINHDGRELLDPRLELLEGVALLPQQWNEAFSRMPDIADVGRHGRPCSHQDPPWYETPVYGRRLCLGQLGDDVTEG